MARRLSATAKALAVACLLAASAGAQDRIPQPDRMLDAAERAEIIDGVIGRLNAAYVFPEVAKKMGEAIRARVEAEEYDGVTSAIAFANMLTEHLRAVSHDKHLRVIYAADGIPDRQDDPTPEARARFIEDARRMNFGFARVERLPGNVGCIDLREFSGLREAAGTGVAAMNFAANADALIFDLRQNGGGSPAMIGLISSYLFDDVVHLNDFYWREDDETRQFWTSPYVQGRRFGQKKPVYVVTSNRTFSAAEEFTYNLKNLKRAVIVGETTGGGAHPGGIRRVSRYFGVWVPAGRAINPVTKTDWEGTGIEPDIKVEARLALKTAHLDALKKLQADAGDARRKALLGQAIEQVQKELREMRATRGDTHPD